MNTANRVLWALIGLLLLAVSVFGVMASQGWLPFIDRDGAVLTQVAIERWEDWSTWATAATIAGGAILVVLGILLVRAQLRGPGGGSISDLVVRPESPDATGPRPGPTVAEAPAGQTLVSASALHHALARDLETDRAVRHAAVHITGRRPEPSVSVRLAVTSEADIAQLQRSLHRAFERFAATSGLQPRLTEVTIRMAEQRPQRVH